MTEHKELLAQVIPGKQSYFQDYVGMFRFRFWQYGSWYDVVVDDQLPFSTALNQLAFAKNAREPNEFWIALLVITEIFIYKYLLSYLLCLIGLVNSFETTNLSGNCINVLLNSDNMANFYFIRKGSAGFLYNFIFLSF